MLLFKPKPITWMIVLALFTFWLHFNVTASLPAIKDGNEMINRRCIFATVAWPFA